MKTIIHQHPLIATLDPLDQYPDYDPADILNRLGFIPSFIADAIEEYGATSETLEKTVLEIYGYNPSPMTGGAFTPNGVYQYPDDPDLYPLAIIMASSLVIYMYPYGMVAFSEPHKVAPTTLYRMD
jgi:hypothetical protein